MSSNLHELFKSNKDLENDGVWFAINDDIKFLIRRFGGGNTKLKQARVKYYKPFARLIEKNLLSEEKERSIFIKSFVDACLVNWEGVEIDGKITEYSFDVAVKLFTDLPELFETLLEQAQTLDNYKEDLGN